MIKHTITAWLEDNGHPITIIIETEDPLTESEVYEWFSSGYRSLIEIADIKIETQTPPEAA